MTSRERVIREIEQASDALVEELLVYLQIRKKQENLKGTRVNGDADQLSQQSILARMGGIPQHLLNDGNLSDRDVRRAVSSDRIQKGYKLKQ